VKGTILLVEDEDDTRDLLGKALVRAGYATLAASTAEEGLALAGEAIPDVIVTDIVLDSDERGGLRLLAELRARGLRTPVVVITAYADVEKVKKALNEGAARLIEKPFSASELLTAIESIRSDRNPENLAEQLFERVRLTEKELTEKERDVARQLIQGLSSNEIAERAGNSAKTIRQHVTQIYAKCGVDNRAGFFRRVYSG
jgi:two-component system, LuxR family, response regulator FixJ